MMKLPHKQCQIMLPFAYFFTIVSISSLLACTGSSSLQSQLIGSWSNLDLTVSINHGSESDSASRFEVPIGKWESILNIKPILTEFKNNGSYRSEYRSLQDSLIRETEGVWEITGDTLILVENGSATRYHAEINGNEVTFSGWLDWDQDGEIDDLYTGRQRKVAYSN